MVRPRQHACAVHSHTWMDPLFAFDPPRKLAVSESHTIMITMAMLNDLGGFPPCFFILFLYKVRHHRNGPD